MLPDLPKLKDDLIKWLQDNATEEIKAADGFLASIPKVLRHEGSLSSYNTVDGDVHAFEPREASAVMSLPYDELPGLSLERAQKLVSDAHKEIHGAMAKHLLAVIEDAVEKSGNATSGHGFTQELYLEALEKIAIDPTSGGLCLVTHPDSDYRRQYEEWLQDPTFVTKLRELAERKRREWLDQEGHRKLVD